MNQTQDEPMVSVKCSLCDTFVWVPEWQTRTGIAFYCPTCSVAMGTNFDQKPQRPQPPSILQEAEQIINGPRRESCGDALVSFERLAQMYTVILHSKLKEAITPHDAALLGVGMKLCRESNKSHRDNRVDMCGYAALADKLVVDMPPETTPEST